MGSAPVLSRLHWSRLLVVGGGGRRAVRGARRALLGAARQHARGARAVRQRAHSVWCCSQSRIVSCSTSPGAHLRRGVRAPAAAAAASSAACTWRSASGSRIVSCSHSMHASPCREFPDGRPIGRYGTTGSRRRPRHEAHVAARDPQAQESPSRPAPRIDAGQGRSMRGPMRATSSSPSTRATAARIPAPSARTVRAKRTWCSPSPARWRSASIPSRA
jgi:hypothetical protein